MAEGVNMDVVATFKANISDMQGNLRTLEADLQKLGATTTATESKMRAMGKGMSDAGKEMSLKITAPLVGIGAAAVAMSTTFDTEMTKLQTLVGLTGDEVAGLKEPIKEMAVEFGASAEEAAKAMFFITSSGLRGADAMDALESSLKASAIGLGETKVVADAVTSAMNAYGPANLDAAKATSIMVGAVREGKMEASSLAGTLGKLLPTASAMGVPFNEVAAALASMSRKGTDAAQGATSLRSIMTALLKPTVDAERAMAGMGTSSEQLRQMIQEKGLLATLQYLSEKFDGNTAATAQVFGNVRALSGVMSMMGGDAQTTADIFGRMADITSGDLNEAFTVASQTTGFKMTQALEAVKDAMMNLGDILMPVVAKIAGGLKLIANWAKDLPQPILIVVTAFGALLAAVGPLLYFGGKMVMSLTALKGAFTGAGLGAKMFGAASQVASSAIGGPLTIAIAAATIGLMAWMNYTIQAKGRVDQLRDSVDQASGSLNAFGTKTIADTLLGEIDPAHWEFMDTLNLGLDEAIAAMQGGEASTQAFINKVWEAEGALSTQGITAGVVANNVYDWGVAVQRAKDEAKVSAAVTEELGGAVGATGDAATAAAGGVGAFTAEEMAAAEQTQELQAGVEALNAMFSTMDANLAAIAAKDAFRQSLADIGTEIDKNSRKLTGNSDAARTNRSAVSDLFTNAKADALAWQRETGASADQTQAHFEGSVKKIKAALRDQKFSPAEIAAFYREARVGSVQAGADVAAGFAAGIDAGAWKAEAQARAMAKMAIMAAHDALKTGSPSKVFEQIGRWTVEGFVIGVGMAASGAVQTTFRLSQDAIDAFVKGMKSKDKDVQEETRRTFGENVQAAYKEVLSGLRDRVKEARQVRDDFGAAIADAGSGNMSLSGAYTGLQDMQEKQNDALKALMDARAKVVGEATAEQTAEIGRLQEAYQTASAATAAYGSTTLAAFENQQARTMQFLTDMRTLMAMGLSENLWQQVYALGAEKGQGLATELINGGATAIQQANAIQAAVDQQADALGVDAAEKWKGSAVVLAQKAVDGFEAEWGKDGKGRARLMKMMNALAESMNREATITVTTVHRDVYESAKVAGLRALGGPVAGDKAYIVGEKGPEVFMPSVNGNIIPNHQLGTVPAMGGGSGGSGGGGGGNYYSIVVQAGVGDPREIGRVVVETITRFERANGPVFARAAG